MRQGLKPAEQGGLSILLEKLNPDWLCPHQKRIWRSSDSSNGELRQNPFRYLQCLISGNYSA